VEVEEGVRISAQPFPISQDAQASSLSLSGAGAGAGALTPYLLVPPGSSRSHEVPQRAAIGKLGGDYQIVLLVLCREDSLGRPVAQPLPHVRVYPQLC